MDLLKKTMLLLIISVVYAPQSQAQVFDDWEARPNISLKYKVNKKWSVAGTYYLYLDKNMSKYNKSVIAGEVDYKVNSWMKAGIDYRYGMNHKDNYHDIRYSLTFSYDPSKKWEIAYRPTLQQEFVSLDETKLAIHPIEYYFRNRLSLSYDVSKKTELYIFTENYQSLNQAELAFNKQKSALGADFEINKRNSIGARMEVINKRKGKMIARPNLSYTYTLGNVKKQKK